MNYTLTLTPEYDAALLQSASERKITPDELIHDAVARRLNNTLEQNEKQRRDVLVTEFDKAISTDTKAIILAKTVVSK